MVIVFSLRFKTLQSPLIYFQSGPQTEEILKLIAPRTKVMPLVFLTKHIGSTLIDSLHISSDKKSCHIGETVTQNSQLLHSRL